MSLTSCLHMILLLCTLCIPCEAAVGYIACTIINDSNCTKYGNAICDTNKCRCVNSYYDDGSTCQKKKKVNAACTANIVCIFPMTCSSGSCQCSKNQYWTEFNCAEQKNVNAACTADRECISPLTCSSGRCQCSSNQFWTGSNCIASKLTFYSSVIL
ncbi:unnamed protein product [Mytilus coruscus]|uniref:EB domain-containing protein n=1 Tax=Mytilus coruscus TaxID=42192 RepID=A0A6J7ZVH8_MYTCO|nr:unnamed protein product [Mytilus coruscus]